MMKRRANRSAPRRLRGLPALCLALVALWATPLLAQGSAGPEAEAAPLEPGKAPGKDSGKTEPVEYVVPTEAQFELYREGAEAFVDGDYEKARQLFLASLRLGELNITYLNYGRTLFRLGECRAAGEAYARTLTAPKIASPSPAQVLLKVEEYRKEMEDACPATITVQCSEPGVQIFIDAMGPLPCAGAAVPVLPGEHSLRALVGERKIEKTVRVGRM